MTKKFNVFIILLISTTILSGCLYPDSELSKNQIPYLDQLQSVQTAVNQFQEDEGGILPIKTKDAETPIYQKYLVDFSRIAPRYLAEPPGNSFENGGIYQYVLVDVEENPTVRVFDLRIAERIREINLRIKANGYPPYDEILARNVYSLDFSKIGYDTPPTVVSPFTGLELPFVVNGQGELFVDYRADLYQLLRENDYDIEPGEDIRWILVEDSVFVPAYSLPYTVESNSDEPIFMTEK
ncbi:hypothetical protein GCM10008967_42230 [Bacillus carboniphilus]|uniref:ABC transporter periplasmic binding protein yphF n=1 Tax=Bacillus carboniphilus TaxID=86663 RepID=A0ABN0WUY0_9BACI